MSETPAQAASEAVRQLLGMELQSASATLVRLGNEVADLRELVAEILDAVEATSSRAGMSAPITEWRQRAGLDTAVATAGTEHIAAGIIADREGA